MANGFQMDISGLVKGLTGTESKSEMAIRMYAETSAMKLQNYARENRPWTDRTSHARQRLTGSVTTTSNGYRLILAHGVSYGIWLELAHEKRYSIIPKTIEYVGTFVIIPGFERLLERLGG